MSLYGAKQVEVNQKLPILCWWATQSSSIWYRVKYLLNSSKFHEFRGCVRQGFDKLGAEVCPQESRQYYAHIADSFQSDVFDLICSNFEDGSDRCANIVVPKVTPSDDTKSFIKPLRDVLKSILEERNKEWDATGLKASQSQLDETHNAYMYSLNSYCEIKTSIV